VDGAVDCLIVGGGPAGLTAAIYVARFRLEVVVIDAGGSRAAGIPCTRNHAGFPGGVSGAELLVRMRRQAVQAGAIVRHGHVSTLTREDGLFQATDDATKLRANTILLATGVTNRRPSIPDDVHAAAVTSGRIRYCPVCDGFEVTDQNLGVIGTAEHGVKEAIFLRGYTNRITLIAPTGMHDLTADQRSELGAAGIVTLNGPPTDFALTREGVTLAVGGDRMTFQAVYPALGSDIHSDLARSLGADLTEEGCVKVDAHQRTSVPGLYAAGDVVIGLDQISHAMGEAGVAATTVRNDLAGIRPQRR
jgi:thioredoxin reductase (NADPH)